MSWAIESTTTVTVGSGANVILTVWTPGIGPQEPPASVEAPLPRSGPPVAPPAYATDSASRTDGHATIRRASRW